MTIRAPATRRGLPARLLRDRDGFVMVMVALLLPVLIGFAGLAAETGLWYAIKRQNQSAADEAAISAAMELVAAKPYSDICNLAKLAATDNGFSFHSFSCPTSSPGLTSPTTGHMYVNQPPVLGASAGNANAVEVILAQQQNSLFASLSLPDVTIDTRAVATAVSTPACLLGLDATGTDVSITGSSAIHTPGCSVVTNSTSSGSVTVSGSATLTAQTIITRGPTSPNPCPTTTCILTTPANITAGVTTDPYASRVASISLPAGPCLADPQVSGSTSPTPGLTRCYNGMTFKNTANVTLTAGVYFVNGNLTIMGGARVSGSGVTFVVYGNGQIAVQSGTPAPTVTLSAPSSGGAPYQGLLFYQVAADNHGASFAGCSPGPPSSCNFTGAIYLPTAPLTYSGNSSSTCTVLIANTITFSGSSTLQASQCGADGVTTPTDLSGAVALAE